MKEKKKERKTWRPKQRKKEASKIIKYSGRAGGEMTERRGE
jgi:hypothetical protein